MLFTSLVVTLINFLIFLNVQVKSDNSTNICTKVVTYAETVYKLHPTLKRVTARRWNGSKYYKWVSNMENVTEIEYKTKVVETCCAGYTKYRSKCVPLCDEVCENAKCTAPNTCTCIKGYTRFNQFRCIPHCENCKYGSCTAPNFCECFSNYEKDSNGTCVPKCSKTCVNSYCANPDFCMCFDGYKLSINATHVCEPICDLPCQNGSCIKPNTCECYEGYINDKQNQEICHPVCENCVNGDCIAPNECKCHDGFAKSAEGLCQPVCEPSCIHGECTSPNVCTCNEGYISENQGICRPVCENCTNGDCIAPNECKCHDGFAISAEGSCQPVCEPICVYGECTSPNVCTCYEGYEVMQNSTSVCEPSCENCENGICVTPGNCQCFEDFEWDFQYEECILRATTITTVYPDELNVFDITTENNYFCDNSTYKCVNGECINNKCICEEGFTPSDEGNDCISLCGQNGYNVSPNSCKCFEGYVLDFNQTNQNYCIPLCDNEKDGCVNGTCIQPNVCKCNEGFELSPSNEFVCVEIESNSNTTTNYIEETVERIESQPDMWILFVIVPLLILASVVLIFTYKKVFRKKDYNVEKRENFSGIVQYSKKDGMAAVI